MKIPDKTVEDLICMIEHSHRDMSYGEGGSFCTDGGGADNKFDKKSAKKAERAIKWLKELILARE